MSEFDDIIEKGGRNPISNENIPPQTPSNSSNSSSILDLLSESGAFEFF